MSSLLPIWAVILYPAGSLHLLCRDFTHSRAAAPSSVYAVHVLWPQAVPLRYCDPHWTPLCYYDLTSTTQLNDCVLLSGLAQPTATVIATVRLLWVAQLRSASPDL